MTSEELLAAARVALEDAYFRTGDYEAATDLADSALAAAESAGDRRAQAAALAQQGMVLHYRAIELPPGERADVDPGPEEALFEQALELREDIGDTEARAESLFQLGLVRQVLRRDGLAAAPYFRAALELVEELPEADVYLRSEIHRHTGFDLLLREERTEEALVHLRTSLELRRTLGAPRTFSGLVALAMAERVAGHRDEAIAHALSAVELARTEGLRERLVAAAETELQAAEALES